MNRAPAIKIGVVGLGAVAQSVHLPLIRRRPELFTLTAIIDISSSLLNAVGDVFGVPREGRFQSVESLLDESGVDAILICSGGSHERIVTAALERGIAVLCEKPLAFTHAELQSIRPLLSGAQTPRLMVGYMKQYDPAVTRLTELLEETDDVRTVDVTVLHPTGQSQLDFAHLIPAGPDIEPSVIEEFRAEDRRLQGIALGDGDDQLWRVYAGCLMSSLSHDMSVLRRLFGSVPDVEYADIWRQRSARQQRETGRDAGGLGNWPPSIRVAGSLSGETRFLMNWHYLHDYPAYRETVHAVHGAGSFELAFPSPYLLHTPTVLTRYASNGAAEARTEFRRIAEAFELQLEAFAEMITEGREPLTGVDGAQQDVLTSQAIIASYALRTGHPVGGEIGRVTGTPLADRPDPKSEIHAGAGTTTR
ncbi:Gfo/Idh/MocA family protein [Arthrobacter sp. YAF17]|uniref:Gfo/Idh/MocA family protein n=1 Tax=Arthrobacter sp. YAF17 TaxID=3233077 RepID=UPI003F90F14B